MKPLLQIIQADFQDYVLGPESGNTAMHGHIADQFGLPAQRRLAIYHNAYRARLREALGEAYEKVHTYLGDELFAEVCAGYVQSCGSPYRNLRWYGDRFAAYLKQALPDYPVVVELAAFEWALGLAFDAADTQVLTLDDVRPLTPDQWESVGYDVSASMQFLSLLWNAPALWLALEHEQTPPDPAASADPQAWLIWRKDLQPHFRSLGDLEADALRRLQQGASFSAVCAAAGESAGEQDASVQIAGWLQNWLGEAVLSKVRYVPAKE